jgi:hypothetical protein
MDIERLPCLTCLKPQAWDVKHLISTGAVFETANQSPNGLPLACCRVRFAGVAPAASPPPTSNEQRPRY